MRIEPDKVRSAFWLCANEILEFLSRPDRLRVRVLQPKASTTHHHRDIVADNNPGLCTRMSYCATSTGTSRVIVGG